MQNKIEYFRGLVYNCYRTGMSSSKIFKTLVSIYENECPSYSFVAKWRRRFVFGQITFEDGLRKGRPMSHEEGKYDEIVKKLIDEDRQISVNEIANILGFSNTKTRNYINNKLGLKKKMCKWIPHCLSDEQKKQRMNFCKNFLEKYENKNEKNIYDIVTGDETWQRF
jgi:transposase